MAEEEKLLMRLKNRKRNAIDEAIEVYTPYLSTVLYNMLGNRLPKEDIEEILSDVFVTLWKNADTIDLEKGTLRAYLAAVARNFALKKLNKQRDYTSLDEIELPDEAAVLEENTADSVVRWFHTSDDETGNQKNQWASPCGHPRPRGRTAEADLASAGYSQCPEMAGNADERRGKEFDGSGITAWTQAFLCLKNSFFEQSCS